MADDEEVGLHKENAKQDTFKKSDEKLDPPEQPPRCPDCDSTRMWKDGLRNPGGERVVQRWLCRDCGLRFSDPTVRPNIPLHHSSSARRPRQSLNTPQSSTGRRQVCATMTEGAKNLAKVEARTSERPAGGTKTGTKSLLFQYAWWMKKEGYSEYTIIGRVKVLRVLARRGADLLDPESVKEAIARQEWCNKRRINAADAYTCFLKMTGGSWTPPRYNYAPKLPFIPQESEIDDLIAGCGGSVSAFLQLLKETAMRCGEAWNLSWTDMDFKSGTVRVTPEKRSNPRIFSLSNRLLSMLNAIPRATDRVFNYSSMSSIRRTYERQRNRIAKKLGNTRLKQITFHTLRHWKATVLYHQTKDVLYVMNYLGHKSIKNTLIYITLEEALFSKQNEEFTCKVAETVQEAKGLVEAGFDYVCEVNNAKLFKKRK